MTEEAELAPAVAVLTHRLHAAEARRRKLQEELAHAVSEVRLTRLALESIASLTGKSDWAPGADEEFQGSQPPSEETTPRRRTDGSTDRVVELLRSESRLWTRDEVYAAFRARNWTDDWADPEAAIRMALKRAEQQGAIRQTRPGVYQASWSRIWRTAVGRADVNT